MALAAVVVAPWSVPGAGTPVVVTAVVAAAAAAAAAAAVVVAVVVTVSSMWKRWFMTDSRGPSEGMRGTGDAARRCRKLPQWPASKDAHVAKRKHTKPNRGMV